MLLRWQGIVDGKGGHKECIQGSASSPGLMGMTWKRGLYIDTTLLFGLKLMLKIFTALANVIE